MRTDRSCRQEGQHLVGSGSGTTAKSSRRTTRPRRRGATMDTTAPTRARSSTWALRMAVILHLFTLLWESITAGRLVTFDLEALPLHYAGAFGVHIVAGTQVLAAAWVWFGSGRTRGLALLVLSAVALGLGFLQATTAPTAPCRPTYPWRWC